MKSVFQDLRYAVQYEQINLDLDDPYGKFARELVKIAQIPVDSKVLDLGCGTGISTYQITDKVPGITVLGVDQSAEFLRMAKLKFGIEDDPELMKIIEEGKFYPPILNSVGNVQNLKRHLRGESPKYRKHRSQVRFLCADASILEDVISDRFDCVFANQFIHWPRKRDAKPGGPLNYEYEKQVLSEIRNILVPKGIFAFNTSGADFRFNEEEMNQRHLSNHPFCTTFKETLRDVLEAEKSPERTYTFNGKEIKRIMEENDFGIERVKNIAISYNPQQLMELCIIGGQMEIFKKMGIDLPAEEREKILQETLEQSLDKIGVPKDPITETGIHYVVRKV